MIAAKPNPTTQRIPGATFAKVVFDAMIATMQAQAKPAAPPADGIGGA